MVLVTEATVGLRVRTQPSALALTLRSPLYRGAMIAVFLSAIGMSAAAPQIASFLVTELHASLTVAGLYYLTNLTAPVAGFLVGSYSDRVGRRLGLFRICAVAGFVGWMGIALSTQVWMSFALTAALLGFAGAASAQLFAALHDDLKVREPARSDGVVSIVRMALTAGWIVGPVLGSFLVAVAGFRTLLVVTAVAVLVQVVPLGFRRSTPVTVIDRPVEDAETEAVALARGPGLRRMVPLLTFIGLFVLVYAGEPIKYGYLPIYMRSDLHLPAVISGAVIGIQPFVELLLMPVALLLGRRIGLMRVMVLGALCGVAANCCFAFLHTAVGLFAGQILMGGVWGVFAALGLLAAQRLLPEAVATASAIFFSAGAISSALGGLAGGIGAGTLGLPLVFIAPAVFAATAAIGLLVMALRQSGVG